MKEDHPNHSNVEILESTRLVDSFIKVDQDVIRHQRLDGSLSRPLSRMVIRKAHSIGVLLYHRDRDAIILVRQFRYPARQDNDGWSIEIVAGNIDEGETAEECVARETMEETGYCIGSLSYMGQGYSSPGVCNEKLYLFFSEVDDQMLVRSGGGLESEGEDIQVMTIPVSEVWQMMVNHKFMDLKTQLAVQWFFLHRNRSRPEETMK